MEIRPIWETAGPALPGSTILRPSQFAETSRWTGCSGCVEGAVETTAATQNSIIVACSHEVNRIGFTGRRLTVGCSAASRASEASGPSESEDGESAATPC